MAKGKRTSTDTEGSSAFNPVVIGGAVIAISFVLYFFLTPSVPTYYDGDETGEYFALETVPPRELPLRERLQRVQSMIRWTASVGAANSRFTAGITKYGAIGLIATHDIPAWDVEREVCYSRCGFYLILITFFFRNWADRKLKRPQRNHFSDRREHRAQPPPLRVLRPARGGALRRGPVRALHLGRDEGAEVRRDVGARGALRADGLSLPAVSLHPLLARDGGLPV